MRYRVPFLRSRDKKLRFMLECPFMISCNRVAQKGKGNMQGLSSPCLLMLEWDARTIYLKKEIF